MKTLEDTLNTMGNAAHALFDTLSQKCSELFRKYGNISPGIFCCGESKGSLQVYDSPNIDDASRPLIWEILRQIRSRNHVTAFVSEVWMAEGKTESLPMPRPSQHPDRKERLMINVWEDKRLVMFLADLNRKPNRLGDWRVFHDSLFPKDGCQVEGGMVQEPDDSQKWN